MCMIRLLETAALSILFLCLPGCNEPEQEPATLEGIKIGDLAPARSTDRGGIEPLKAANFNVYTFEMPAERIDALDDIWLMLRAEPLRFNNYEAFEANSFRVGSGQDPILDELVNMLRRAGGKKVQMVSLLLPDNRGNNLWVAPVPPEQTVFYTSATGAMEAVTLGPGSIGLRLTAQIFPGLRGLCDVRVQPAFISPLRGPVPRTDGRPGSGDFSFTLTGFNLKMSPGDFLLLGPGKDIAEGITLASYFFSRPAPNPRVKMFLPPPSGAGGKVQPYNGPVVRTYLVICTGVND
jgi:hypothetical protein